MAGPTKRTRANANDQSVTTPSPEPTSADASTPTRRRSSAEMTPTRPIITRSNTALPTPPTLTSLTRSTSQFIATRRASAVLNATFTTPALPGPSGRGGVLARTQSQPIIASTSSLKATASAPGGLGRDKGDPSPDLGLGSRRPGRGKENIPPKKDQEGDDESSRKRLRVGSRSDKSGRTRSGSVSSMRSEGRMSSAASSSFSQRTSRLPSPSPSPSSATSQSLDTASVATSHDPLDVLDEEVDLMDVDKTPTKPKTRHPVLALPTPPPSSPFANLEIDATAKRIGLVRMCSDTSDDTSTDTDEARDIGPYKSLKSFLRLANSGDNIVGRHEEQKAIREYVAGTYKLDVGMYVSGPPGTGKTATVTSMAKALGNEGWRRIEICCMGLKANDLWAHLGNALNCAGSEVEVCSTLRNTEDPLLVILDEIDSLMPPAPSPAPPAMSHLLSKIFSLPTTTDGRVKVIAISNTLDLTLRARLILPDGATPLVLPFKAYAGMDMVDIVSARIQYAATDRPANHVQVDGKALELLTKKVEAQNGDLRMCLSVLTSAVNLAEVEWNKKVMSSESGRGSASIPLIKISLSHIIKAFTTYTMQLRAAAGSNTAAASSVTGKKVRSVPLQGKMVLVAMLVMLARARVGLSGVSGSSTPTSPAKSSEPLTTSSLYAAYVHLLSHNNSPYPPSSESDYQDLLSNLEVLGLVTIVAGSTSMARTSSSSSTRVKSHGQRIELCAREEEIQEGLSLKESGKKGTADEEVARIWERESGRIARYTEKRSLEKARTADVDLW